jgi:hypothetical protein
MNTTGPGQSFHAVMASLGGIEAVLSGPQGLYRHGELGRVELFEGLIVDPPAGVHNRHVLATAIRCGAAVLVTFNLNGFPATPPEKYGIEVQHPDAFVTHLLDLSPPRVCTAVKRQRAGLKNSPKSLDDFMETLPCNACQKPCLVSASTGNSSDPRLPC